MNINCARSEGAKEALNYNFKKCDQDFALLKEKEPKKYDDISSTIQNEKDLVANIVDSNMGKSFQNLKGAQKIFTAVQSLANDQARTKYYSSHIKVSFPKEERNLNESMMKNIGKDVLKKLNYNNTPYLIFQHKDEPHPHIHIVTSTHDFDGNYITSSFEGIRSKYVERELEDKYGLIKKLDRAKKNEASLDGVRDRGFFEQKVFDKSKEVNEDKYGVKVADESYLNIIRTSLNTAYSDSIKSLDAFANRLNREGISLKFKEIKREGKNGVESIYGVSYGLEPNKINFQFNNPSEQLPKKYLGFQVDNNVKEEFSKNDFVAFSAGDNKLYASKTFHNGLFFTKDKIKYPSLPDDTKNTFAIGGLKAGNKFSLKNIRSEIGFSDNDIRNYISTGNTNVLDEEPKISKLLYSTLRENHIGIEEAFSDGARIDDIKPIDWESLSKNYKELLLVSEKEYANDKSSVKENELSDLIEQFRKNYYSPHEKTIELAQAYLDGDHDKMNSLLTYSKDFENGDLIADTRIIGIDNIMGNSDINIITQYTFKDQNDFIIKQALWNDEISEKDDRSIVAATSAVDRALENKDFDALEDAIQNDLVDYSRLKLDNTRWLDKESNQNLFLIANNDDLDKANKQLMMRGFDPISMDRTNSGSSNIDSNGNEGKSKDIDRDNSAKRNNSFDI